jgi:hypothetical protein
MSCVNGRTVIAGCDLENQRHSVCAVCSPAPRDTQCAACAKGACCAELQELRGADDVAGFDRCVSSCDTLACADACFTSFPHAAAAYDKGVDCQNKSCRSACLCPVEATDGACFECIKSSCCDLWADYQTTSDFNAFTTCMDACANGDAACPEDCQKKSTEAGLAYEKLRVQCIEGTCASACR